MGPLLKYSDKLYDILDQIQLETSDSVALDLIKIEADPALHNGLKIELVDISTDSWSFDVTISGKVQSMKIGKFIRYFLQGSFSEKQIYNFSNTYNGIISGYGVEKKISGTLITPETFKLNPLDVRSTFISLVTETYPYGHEEEVVKYLPTDLIKDEFGNYYKIIGKSETMFTCHLDTADRKKSKVTLYSEKKDDQEYIVTDERTILGADDKSGVCILMYMMANNIPGVYYFFIGEERGGIGSTDVARVFSTIPHLKGMKRCVSFDRRNYYSVITEQMGDRCCSDDFGQALCDEYNSMGMMFKLDPTGVYTDSANFVELIPECTNISVGYFNEHTVDEYQNITYLEKLAKASIKINWESLPTKKKIGVDDYILDKYRKLLTDLKTTSFNIPINVHTERGFSYIKMEIDGVDVSLVHDDLWHLGVIFQKNSFNPDIYFDEQFLKIELK